LRRAAPKRRGRREADRQRSDFEELAQRAREAGNSPQMIFRHYRELVRPADAQKWFAVTLASVQAAKAAREGDKEGKIIPIPKTAAV